MSIEDPRRWHGDSWPLSCLPESNQTREFIANRVRLTCVPRRQPGCRVGRDA
jgi:hypothetical protein